MLAVDPGNIMDRRSEEYYISSPFKLPNDAKVSTICWDAELQEKTWIKAQIRFAISEEMLNQALWQGPLSYGGWFTNGQNAERIHQTGNWIQYRLALGAVNGGNSPRIKSVEVEYGYPPFSNIIQQH